MAQGVKFKMAAGVFKPFCLATIFAAYFITLLYKTEGAAFWDKFTPHTLYVKHVLQSMNDASLRDIEEVDFIKQRVVNTAGFEIGYIIQIIQDKYRKMIDKYILCKDLVTKHHVFLEMVIYLEEIEHGYWQVEHIACATPRSGRPHASKVSKPLNETILDAAPWSIKLLMLKDMTPTTTPLPFHYRRVGVEALIQRRQDMSTVAGIVAGAENDDDENNMRLKLFRLMYETVRDSDLKVKRAELIRKHYTNSSAFEVGFLMGEVQEKFDIIQEFSGTLQKFYDTWKPIEHINAYEQIANYAIQVNHLVDLVRTIAKNST